MKKYILILFIIIGLFISLNDISAKNKLSQSNINTIISLLRKFDVEEYKIKAIIDILKTPQIKEQKQIKRSIKNKIWQGPYTQPEA